MLYGTGDGADRLIDSFEKRNIKIEGVFASDNFVRDRSFRGFKVLSYSEAKQTFGKMTIVLGFGTHDKSVIEHILAISKENDLYMPEVIEDKEGQVFDLENYYKHRDEISFAYSLLADELSQKSFTSIINYRLSGKLEYLLDCQVEERESWKLLNINRKEVYVDCGAYNGDTIARFSSFTKEWKAIYAFEPDKKTFKKLEKNTASLNNLFLYNAAVSNSVGQLPFFVGKGRGTKLGGTVMTPCLSIDSVLEGKEATILKFDTEGFEKEAIEGGKNTISTFKPKMILSSYHKGEDLWTLPKLVLALNKDYKFYLRNAPCLPYWDANYYIM